jgi:MFS family permease
MQTLCRRPSFLHDHRCGDGYRVVAERVARVCSRDGRQGRMTLLRALLANRDLTRVEVAWAAAALGDYAFSILLALYAYGEGGAGAVALTVVVRMLPSGVVAPYTAMLADRHSRRAILIWASAARAATLLGAAVAAWQGASLAVVLVFGAANTIAFTAHMPAQMALMPLLARSPTELAAANVLWSVVDYTGYLLGGLAAAALVTLAGLGTGIAACAAVCAAAALACAGLPRDARPEPLEESRRVLAELADGLRTVARHPQIRVLQLAYAAKGVVEGAMDVLIVLAALELLHIGQSGAGWLSAAWGAGGVLGGVVSLAMLHRGWLASGLVTGFVIAGASFALIGVLDLPGPAYVLLLIAGIGGVLLEAAHLTLTQRLASDDVLGRVFGVQQTAEVIAVALGSVVAAVLTNVLDVRGAIIATGLALPLVAALVYRSVAGSEAGARVPERAFALLRALPLFRSLPVATLETLSLRSSERSFEAGTAIVRAGDPGHEFFVIADGEVEVEVGSGAGGRRHLGAGEFFGEIALLHDVPRTATVSALGRVNAVVLDREQFLDGISAHPRSAAAAEAAARTRLADSAAQPADRAPAGPLQR